MKIIRLLPMYLTLKSKCEVQFCFPFTPAELTALAINFRRLEFQLVAFRTLLLLAEL